MNLAEIKKAVDNGETVNWSNELYEVQKDKNGEYYINCTANNSAIGLTWTDEVTMNGDEKDFYIK